MADDKKQPDVEQPEPKKDYRLAVKKILDYHFEAMGIRPMPSEFAGVQTAIVHLLDTGELPSHVTEAEQRVKDELEEVSQQAYEATAHYNREVLNK